MVKNNWLPAGVIFLSVVVLSFWHFRQTEHPVTRRAFSVGNVNDFSWRNRLSAWEGTLQMMADRPWLGFGWNQPEPIYGNYYRANEVMEADAAAIRMDDCLMLGATLGIPALFCFSVYIWLSLSRSGFGVPPLGGSPPNRVNAESKPHLGLPPCGLPRRCDCFARGLLV